MIEARMIKFKAAPEPRQPSPDYGREGMEAVRPDEGNCALSNHSAATSQRSPRPRPLSRKRQREEEGMTPWPS